MIKILLVEDDKIIVASLSEYLNSEGYLVRSVSGQTAAMKLLAEEKADLVLLDVSLAEGNGFAACSAIKAEFDTQPLIARGFRDLKIGGKCAAVQKLLNTLRRICPAYHLGRTKIARGISGCNMDTIVPVPCGKPAIIRNQAVAAVVKSFQKCRAIL